MFQPLLPAFHHLTMLCVMETTDVCMLVLTGVQNVHVDIIIKAFTFASHVSYTCGAKF